jgi:hypothetical protein
MTVSSEKVLKAVDELLAAFGDHAAIPTDAALAALSGDESLLTHCLGFLLDRDLVLFAAGDHRLYHRPRLVQQVAALIRAEGPLRPEEISEALALPDAITCQIVGWLERDGQIVVAEAADGVSISARSTAAAPFIRPAAPKLRDPAR